MGKVTKYRDYRVVHLDQGDSLVETDADGGHGAGAARGAGEKRSAQKWPLSANQPRPMAGRTDDQTSPIIVENSCLVELEIQWL